MRCAVRAGGETVWAEANFRHLRAVVASGAPLVLVGEMTQERDYSGGEATALWAEAIAAGARRVSDDGAAFSAVLETTDGERAHG